MIKLFRRISFDFHSDLSSHHPTNRLLLGVFLIPYSTMLLFGALPLFFMELSLGQWAKTGPISLWSKICPPLKGIGYCFVLISWYVSFYYNVIIAWTISYVIKTLVSGRIHSMHAIRNSQVFHKSDRMHRTEINFPI